MLSLKVFSIQLRNYIKSFFAEKQIVVSQRRTGNPFSFWNRLDEPEKQFKTKEDAKRDWELFPENPDPDYSEFCNDIFGDG